jgi:23S rRNA (adenine2503-C2)-methyltransferase
MNQIKSKEHLREMLLEIGTESFRTNQIWEWIYNKGCNDFIKMTNLSSNLREKLSEYIRIPRLNTKVELMSRDGTIKWLLGLDDKNEIETVFIPEKNRGTVCVSSQVGCTLTCKFCHTGTQKLVRNLTANEIVSQVMIVKDKINDWCNSTEKRLSNIVFMGMGEPMLNYENVADAVRILTDKNGLNYGKKRITISTSGLVPQIEQCAKDLGVRLAISLHAVTDDLRDELVPINKKYKIQELLNACKDYADATGGERITFEYVMLDGVNDSDADARKLVYLLKRIPSKVNLIPFNPWPGSPYVCSPEERIKRFSAIVRKAGYISPVRVTRGQDIMAACGQLKSNSIKLNHKLKNSHTQL